MSLLHRTLHEKDNVRPLSEAHQVHSKIWITNFEILIQPLNTGPYRFVWIKTAPCTLLLQELCLKSFISEKVLSQNFQSCIWRILIRMWRISGTSTEFLRIIATSLYIDLWFSIFGKHHLGMKDDNFLCIMRNFSFWHLSMLYACALESYSTISTLNKSISCYLSQQTFSFRMQKV